MKNKLFKCVNLLLFFLYLPILAQIEFKDFKELDIKDLLNSDVQIATKTILKLDEAPSIVSVISDKEIKNMGARDLRDVLRTIPGFELGIRYFGYNKFGVRGIFTDNTEKIKLLIDGLPVNEHLEGSGTIVFADISLDNIKKIEIIRGPGSALYGANAFLSVINVITKSGEDIEGVNLKLKGGSNKFKEASLLFGKKNGDFSYSGYLNFLDTDGPRMFIKSDALSLDPLNSDISLAGTDLGYTDLHRKKMTFSLNLKYKTLSFNGYFIDSKKGSYLGAGFAVNRESEAHPSQLQGIIRYEFKLGKLDGEVKIYSLKYEADNLWNLYPSGYKEQGNNEIITYHNGYFQLNGGKQKTIGSQIKFLYTLRKIHQLIFGFSYENIKLYDINIKESLPDGNKFNMIDSPSIMLKEPTRKIFSAYIQEHATLNSKLSLTAGLRFDNYSDAGTSLSPRLGLVFKPLNRISFKLLYAEAFRAPTFVESYLHALGGFVLGNEKNKPETIKTLEFETSFELSNSAIFRINLFYNKIKNLLTLFPFETHLEYINTEEEINFFGIESEIKMALSNGIYGFLNYSYNYGKSKTSNSRVIGSANHIGNIGINAEISKNINFNSILTFVSKRARDKSSELSDLHGYIFGTVSIIIKNIIEGLDFNISAYNFLNQNFRVPDTTGFFRYDYPLESRSFVIGVNYNIK